MTHVLCITSWKIIMEEDRLNPQKNSALACAIKSNPIRGSANNGGLQPSKCKSQLMGILKPLLEDYCLKY